MSKSGSWINNHLFTYTPYFSVEAAANFSVEKTPITQFSMHTLQAR